MPVHPFSDELCTIKPVPDKLMVFEDVTEEGSFDCMAGLFLNGLRIAGPNAPGR
jgi:hypothetical protein